LGRQLRACPQGGAPCCGWRDPDGGPHRQPGGESPSRPNRHRRGGHGDPLAEGGRRVPAGSLPGHPSGHRWARRPGCWAGRGGALPAGRAAAAPRRVPRPGGVAGEVERAPGDVLDPASLTTACSGCQVVFHAAAFYDLWAADPDQFYAVNVRGTENVLQAARETGVEAVVYTSSVSTIPPAAIPDSAAAEAQAGRRGGDERWFADPKSVHSHYKRSKILAEQVALEKARQGWSVVVVNPSTPVGCGDARPTPTGKIVLDFLRGRLPAYVDTGLNVVDVDDVAQGHVLALEHGKAGERYILGNRDVTLKELLALLASETGRPAPKVRLPFAVALAIGSASEVIQGRLMRTVPAVPLEGVRMARTAMFYDPSRARRELGLPQTPIAVALGKAVRWYERHGYC